MLDENKNSNDTIIDKLSKELSHFLGLDDDEMSLDEYYELDLSRLRIIRERMMYTARELLQKRNRSLIVIAVILLLNITITIIGIIVNGNNFELGSIYTLICILLLLFGTRFFSGYLNFTKKKGELNYNIKRLNEQIFILEIEDLKDEEKAMRQLYDRQVVLEDYYDLTLRHMRYIYKIGIAIIIFGAIVILSTMVLAFINKDGIDSMVLITGFVGGVLIDAIGAVFIAMYSKTIDTASSYQIGMVDVSSAYFGNLLASKIKNNELKDKTYSEMAVKLSEMREKKR